MILIEDRYLGDGVYASWDGYHVVLDLRAQGPDRIALEPSVLRELDRFRGDVARLATDEAAMGGCDEEA